MELLKIENGQATVSSRQVAEHFGKRHVEVMDNIRKTIDDIGCVENSTDLFQETTYINTQNKQQYKEYLMNRDGFCLVAMGFTGKKALQWKLKYIEAFNNMEKQIRMQEQTEVNNISIPQVVPMLCKEFMDLEKRISALEKQPILIKEETENEIKAIVKRISEKTGIWYPKVYEIVYRKMEEKYGHNLDSLLNRQHRKMRKDKVCKTKIDNFRKVNLIQQNKTLFKCFENVGKEMLG